MAIPHVLHQIWLGDGPPAEQADWCRRWAGLNPAWQIHLWRQAGDVLADGEVVFAPSLLDVAERATRPEQRSEIFRLELMHRLGGVYADCDCQPLAPLDPIVEGHEAFASTHWHLPRAASCAFFGASVGHPWIAACLEEIPKLDPSSRFAFATPLLCQMLRHDVVLLGREVVINSREPVSPGGRTIAVHRFSTNRRN